MDLRNGDCLELMKTLPDKSVDLFICDLPYGETNCKWDTCIDLEEFWKEFKRIRKSKKTACIHFCSTKFGYNLISSNPEMFKMDMVWKKRNKTGGLQSRCRPMRNHEMVYFFYDSAPKYNRDKYHKRIQVEKKTEAPKKKCGKKVVEDKGMDEFGWSVGKLPKENRGREGFEPVLPVSVVEEKIWTTELGSLEYQKTIEKPLNGRPRYDPALPVSILEMDNELDLYDYIENPEEAPFSVFESKKVFIGKRHHQTEKPQDILEFFLKYWTDENDTVLDPTMGSGSTGVACQKLKRKFIGFELDEKIFKTAQKRIEEKK
jgi:DNA modification methylase